MEDSVYEIVCAFTEHGAECIQIRLANADGSFTEPIVRIEPEDRFKEIEETYTEAQTVKRPVRVGKLIAVDADGNPKVERIEVQVEKVRTVKVERTADEILDLLNERIAAEVAKYTKPEKPAPVDDAVSQAIAKLVTPPKKPPK